MSQLFFHNGAWVSTEAIIKIREERDAKNGVKAPEILQGSAETMLSPEAVEAHKEFDERMKANPSEGVEVAEDVIDYSPTETTIEQLREQYKQKLGKNVANAYKNNREWILSKLN